MLARLGGVDPYEVLLWEPARLRFNLDCLHAWLEFSDHRMNQINGAGGFVFPVFQVGGL